MHVLFVVGIILCTWAGLALITLTWWNEWQEVRQEDKPSLMHPGMWYSRLVWISIFNTIMELVNWPGHRQKTAIFWVGLAGVILLLV
tara:strand:- start:685 stop:945 length:261 start_codon:yes stop_codon:yes gene_type:complete